MAEHPGWVFEATPPAAGLYVVAVGGSSVLARWNARDRRWYDGYRFIDPRHVRGFFAVAEFPALDVDRC